MYTHLKYYFFCFIKFFITIKFHYNKIINNRNLYKIVLLTYWSFSSSFMHGNILCCGFQIIIDSNTIRVKYIYINIEGQRKLYVYSEQQTYDKSFKIGQRNFGL